ncbi:MAG: tetraacyldisaccharide 4'-kinase [Armatimonadetes bacterium]|nr:tetraacyldisaccharide 4'-kinase [Armatimonadota bacterium]
MTRLEAYLMQAVFGGRSDVTARLVRAGLAVLSMIYSALLKGYLGLVRNGILPRTRLPVPVISVGNITLGGTGKTTSVRYLAEFFQERGFRVGVLSHGYQPHRKKSEVGVVSDGERILMDAARSGDEPHMLAKMLPGTAVLIGRRRNESGRAAVEELGCNLVLVDDGFQYWRLDKDLEIVLIDATDPFSNGWPIPRGLLREPLSHLSRASSFMITNIEYVSEEKLYQIREFLYRRFPAKPLAESRRIARRLRNLKTGETESIAYLDGKGIGALSTLGNHLPFESSLQRLGAKITPFRYSDHHRYSEAEFAEILGKAFEGGLEAIVTTEKDAVKIEPDWLGSLPVMALDASLHIVKGQRELEKMLREAII